MAKSGIRDQRVQNSILPSFAVYVDLVPVKSDQGEISLAGVAWMIGEWIPPQ
ncbi:hypothetical protein AVEN_84310-1, partial [Araneus ventricosus]